MRKCLQHVVVGWSPEFAIIPKQRIVEKGVLLPHRHSLADVRCWADLHQLQPRRHQWQLHQRLPWGLIHALTPQNRYMGVHPARKTKSWWVVGSENIRPFFPFFFRFKSHSRCFISLKKNEHKKQDLRPLLTDTPGTCCQRCAYPAVSQPHPIPGDQSSWLSACTS